MSVIGDDAFTRYGPKDHRVDLKSIERKFGLLPADPVEQNRLWYKIYKSVETDASVQDAHGDFLFSRDYACLALFIAITLGTAGFLQIPSITTALVYFGVLVLQFLMTWRAARDRGCRLVTNVLAVQGAKG